MTEEEKEEERKAKIGCTEYLHKVDIPAYDLKQIDGRLQTYAETLIMHPDEHNLYELLALQRFFHFLGTYTLKIDEVQKFIKFYEYLKFDGTHGRTRYKLTPVQVFQFTNIFGFYRDDTHRLCREAVLFVPRKFSKTTSVAAIAVYDFLYGDTNAQAYTAANTHDQASICFKEIKNILKGLDSDKFKFTRELARWKNGERDSIIHCLSNSPDKLDGLNASVIILDEYSQADSSDLKDVLTTSMAMRENPLTITITTASDKPNGPFAEELKSYYQILKGELDDDSIFLHLFQPDVDDVDDSDPKLWHKVQPHLGITAKEDFYQQAYDKSQRTAGDKKAFRTKLLNVFDSDSGHKWISSHDIVSHKRNIDIDNIGYNAECVVSVDLSVDNDFSCVSYYIYLYDEKKSHIYTEYYFPEGRLSKHPNKDLYKRWAKNGFLKLCKGNIIDYQQIANDIISHGAYLKILSIAFDPNRAMEFQNLLKSMGAGNYMHAYKQTNYYFTIPVQTIPRMLEQNLLTFDGNPINAYCFDNCVLDIDRMENAKPIKQKEYLKIDGAITACMAVGASMNVMRTEVAK